MLMRTKPSGLPSAGLPRPGALHPARVITVTGGKGGVGKTNVSVNLAVALAGMGKDVLLMDADLGLASVDVLLGLRPGATLADVIDGSCSLEDTLLEGPSGVKIVPAASGVQRMAELTTIEHAGLIRAFSDLSLNVDVLVVDSAAGISDAVINFCRAAQEVVMVACDEPVSVSAASALIRLLSREHDVQRFRLLANMVDNPQAGRRVYEKVARASDPRLCISLDYLGHVPSDDQLRKAVQQQRAVVDAYPRAKSSLAFKTLAAKTESWPLPDAAGARLEFFVERLVQPRNREPEVIE